MVQRKNQALSAEIALKLSQLSLKLTGDLGSNLTVSKQMVLEELVVFLESDPVFYKKILKAIRKRKVGSRTVTTL